jgi:phage terminase large subunit-like protein
LRVSHALAASLASALETGWQVTARSNQLPPDGDWSIWLLLAGRGFGKTRVLSEMANAWASSGQTKRIAIVAATAADARDVMVEGESGILATAPPWCVPVYQSTRRRLEWPNGALAYCYSAEEPDRLRGPQHDGALLDELASWRDPSTFDMLMFGLRLGKHPRTVIATTLRPTKLVRQLLAREGNDLVVTRGSTYENADNLAPAFFSQIVNRYEGTRLGRQELLAEVLMDIPGALWSLDTIDKGRRDRAPDLRRIVVAIDPAISSHEGSDETGIIVAGRDERGHGWVLEDLSGKYQPHEWARTAIEAYGRHSADRRAATWSKTRYARSTRTYPLPRCTPPAESSRAPSPLLRYMSRAACIMSAISLSSKTNRLVLSPILTAAKWARPTGSTRWSGH